MSSTRNIVIPAPAKHAFGALQAVSPTLAARLAERWFFTPPRARRSRDVVALLRSARRFTLRVENRLVTGWEWGTGPTVYLVHGWGSMGGHLGAFARPLIDSGHRVVTFDAPGHGASGRGLSSMPEFARALQAIADRHGAARAVIAHSLGGSASVLAARWGLGAERFALLAPAADPAAFASVFASVLGVRDGVMAHARARSERRLRFSWTELDVPAAARHIAAPALVVHDRHDEVVPFAEGATIAASWPGARLFATNGLGHRGVMRDRTVIDEVVRFVTDSGATTAPMTEAGRLEHELFHPESRWR